GALPPPTEPRPAGVRSSLRLPEAGRPAAGWGRVGEGGWLWLDEPRQQIRTPPLAPPHKGEGNTTESAALSSVKLRERWHDSSQSAAGGRIGKARGLPYKADNHSEPIKGAKPHCERPPVPWQRSLR